MKTETLRYPQWQRLLQEAVSHRGDADIAQRIAAVRDKIQSRLRIMTPADAEERGALKGALATLASLAPRKL